MYISPLNSLPSLIIPSTLPIHSLSQFFPLHFSPLSFQIKLFFFSLSPTSVDSFESINSIVFSRFSFNCGDCVVVFLVVVHHPWFRRWWFWPRVLGAPFPRVLVALFSLIMGLSCFNYLLYCFIYSWSLSYTLFLQYYLMKFHTLILLCYLRLDTFRPIYAV